ncbi:MAG: NAD(P)-binding protein [Desulfarculaceae bacterium]|nr:NAD(P)-binding protein [Desulfarculaceae bacterium]
MNHKNDITTMAALPKVPITSGDMDFNRTGLWRYLMPAVQERTAPCQAACPLGMPSPDFINDLLRQDGAQALGRVLAVNPLPGVTGRLCYHPCQAKCLRKELDHNLKIQMLERHLADTASEPATAGRNQTGPAAAVLGAGPLGLAAAYFLGLAGLTVSLIDPLEQPGGFLTSLEPGKLSPEALGRESARLIRLAGLKPVMGAEFAALAAEGPGDGWALVIHDQSAHAPDSTPGQSLADLATRLVPGPIRLDSAALCPNGAYKASQVALALAAGRELAALALSDLGMAAQSQELQELGEGPRAGEPVKAEEIRYDLFEAAGPGPEGDAFASEEQALAEAGRCLSCGHCNLCGRCMVFCPDVSLSVNPQGTAPEVDEMHCKGCGICAHECPRRALVMTR